MSVGGDEASGNDFQAIVAVADGTPYINMNAVQPYLWHQEQGKSWYVLSNTISYGGGADLSYSICIPPGTYTLQYWDVCGGGGYCPGGDGFNAGTPPNTTYGSGWEIGDPSGPISVVSGAVANASLYSVHSNVPGYDNFYGGYGIWSYGACDAGETCPGTTTCYQGACTDFNYDIRSCGSGGNPCDAGSCCQASCTDEGSDPNNCGGCGVQCGPGSTCTSGQCVSTGSTCGTLSVGVNRDYPDDPTNYEGLFAVENGRPHLNDGESNLKFWPAEQAKTWYPLNAQVFPLTEQTLYFSACVPPGNYTVQFWNDGCINNPSGCGTFPNGTPPSSYVYLWQIGDASQTVTVSAGTTTGMTLLETQTNVPLDDNFYDTYSVWSYGGCGTFCPPETSCNTATCPSGTSCYEGGCYDLSHDVRNCGTGGDAISDGGVCCNGLDSNIQADPANCGGCGIGCDSGICSNFACQ